MAISATTRAFVKRALYIIRTSNGLNADTGSELARLGRQMRVLIIEADLSNSTARRRDMNALINELALRIEATFARIAAHQVAATGQLIELEAAWAHSLGSFPRAASETALATAQRTLTVLGSTVEEHWQKQAQNLLFRVRAQVRMGMTAGEDGSTIAARVSGRGKQQSGGVLDVAKNEARGLVDAAAHAAADAGKREVMKANGVNALQWLAVLDPKVCPSCGERSGKLWTIDGEPLGHDIPYEPVPLHPWCRCLFMPMMYDGAPPEDGGDQKNEFEDWLATLDDKEQNNVLGKGRAELWRADKISTADLIGQRGQVMSLAELRALTEAGEGP